VTQPPPLVDSHCHLDFPDFADELDEVVARARRAGLVRMVTIGTRVREFDKILGIAERFEDVYCTVGTHPHNAGEETDVTADQLVALANSSPKVVGIGECGLDYFYDHGPREAQAAGFRTHIEAARRTGLPVIVHTRDATRTPGRSSRSATRRARSPACCTASAPAASWRCGPSTSASTSRCPAS